MSFTEGLTLLFIGLKLTDYIDWSWWWVFAPTIIHIGIAIIATAFVVVKKVGWRK